MKLRAGDALYIPDSYWHVIQSSGRNIALSMELGIRRSGMGQYTEAMRMLSMHPGTLWAEKRKLEQSNKEGNARMVPITPETQTQCTKPLAQLPSSLAEYPGWHGNPFDAPPRRK